MGAPPRPRRCPPPRPGARPRGSSACCSGSGPGRPTGAGLRVPRGPRRPPLSLFPRAYRRRPTPSATSRPSLRPRHGPAGGPGRPSTRGTGRTRRLGRPRAGGGGADGPARRPATPRRSQPRRKETTSVPTRRPRSQGRGVHCGRRVARGYHLPAPAPSSSLLSVPTPSPLSRRRGSLTARSRETRIARGRGGPPPLPLPLRRPLQARQRRSWPPPGPGRRRRGHGGAPLLLLRRMRPEMPRRTRGRAGSGARRRWRLTRREGRAGPRRCAGGRRGRAWLALARDRVRTDPRAPDGGSRWVASPASRRASRPWACVGLGRHKGVGEKGQSDGVARGARRRSRRGRAVSFSIRALSEPLMDPA